MLKKSKRTHLSSDCPSDHRQGDSSKSQSASGHPDHRLMLPRLKKVEGQIAGIQRMVAEGRYCVDILVQFQAAASALRAIESTIFEKHLKSCVTQAMASQNAREVQEKTQELVNLVFKRLK